MNATYFFNQTSIDSTTFELFETVTPSTFLKKRFEESSAIKVLFKNVQVHTSKSEDQKCVNL